MFQHLLREESIRLHLDAPSREAALAELVALLPSWGISAKQKGEVLDLVLQRERFGTTAIGDGIALPHCVFHGIAEPLASVGISKKGISYPSLDGAPVNVLLLVIFPENMNSHYERYRVLHDAEVLFRDPFVRERLKISETPEEAFEIILRESNSLSLNFKAVGNR
jgi:fructose PTS system EIIBC or EIIC component